MADIPDFRSRIAPLDPMAFARVAQQRSQMEQDQANLQQKRKDEQIANITKAVQAGQQIASSMMDLAEKRNQAKGLASLSSDLQTPPPTPPSPMASSTALPEQGQFGVQPSPEQNQAYQGQLQQRQRDLVTHLTQANAPKVTEAMAKGMFEPKGGGSGMDLQKHDALVDGERASLLFDPHSGVNYDANTLQRVTGKISPIIPAAEDTVITAKDRAELGPMAQRLVAGTAKAGDLVNARGNRKEKLARIATELDPNYDPTTVSQRIAVRKDFTPSGTSGKALQAFNTAILHSDTLEEKISRLDNGKFPLWNKYANKASAAVGHPELAGFNVVRNFFADEMAKAAQGGGGIITEEERKRQLEAFDQASSPAQMKEAVSSAIQLMASKTSTVKAGWTTTMGEQKPAVPFVTPQVEKVLKKRGIDPNTLESTAPASTGLKPTMRYNPATGKVEPM